jgi:flagellar motor switch protein FliG
MAEEITNGIFLNGKNKLIKMFQLLTEEEKSSLLEKVGRKNPKLAEELKFKSITFKKMFSLNDKSIRLVINQVNPSILGISLKGSPINQQRRILSLAKRDYAEKAFSMLTTSINDEEKSIIKSQQKVIASIGSLNKMGLVEI